MQAKNRSKIRPLSKSKSSFYGFFESNYQISASHRALIGVQFFKSKPSRFDDNVHKNLVLEKISHGDIISVEHFGVHDDTVNSVLVNKRVGALLVGDSEGRLVQYDLSEGRSMLRVQRDYGEIHSGQISCFAALGQFAFIGTFDYVVKVVDMRRRLLLSGSVTTAIQIIYSLQICRVTSNKVFLTVTGKNPNYLSGQSDIYDVSILSNNHIIS